MSLIFHLSERDCHPPACLAAGFSLPIPCGWVTLSLSAYANIHWSTERKFSPAIALRTLSPAVQCFSSYPQCLFFVSWCQVGLKFWKNVPSPPALELSMLKSSYFSGIKSDLIKLIITTTTSIIIIIIRITCWDFGQFSRGIVTEHQYYTSDSQRH